MFKTGITLSVFLLLTIAFKGEITTTPYRFAELKYFPPMPASVSNPVTVEGVELGRYLFYDPVLSADSSMSCAGCHRQEAAFSDAPNIFSKGIKGKLMKRNTMPLFNLAWYPSFFWDGKAGSVEEQVFHPVRADDEMNLQWNVAVNRLKRNKFYLPKFVAAFGNTTIDSVLITNSIAQFLRTIISYRSKYDKVLNGETLFTKDEYEGFILMNDMTKGDCLHCHTTDADALGTARTFSNNGLDSTNQPEKFIDKGRGEVTRKKEDNGKFKIPSLRNVALTAPYMHDGRFATLEQVLDFYSEGVNQSVNIDSKMEYAHQKGVKLSLDEKKKIISFLKTLTDSSFICDASFTNPFVNKKITSQRKK